MRFHNLFRHKKWDDNLKNKYLHMKIGVIGSGSMGSGIAQWSAQKGFETLLQDIHLTALSKAENQINASLEKLVSKEKISAAEKEEVLSRLSFVQELSQLSDCDIIIEAIIENIEIKKQVFAQLEGLVKEDCIIATNTSSLSVTALAASLKKPERFLGLHFFNPATLMPLVEVIPGMLTSSEYLAKAENWIDSLGKVKVLTKDTPGFIVNRVARPFYGEALRIYEEGLATPEEIDYVMKEKGKFRMGPFELMDLIGNDVNYTVSETVWTHMYYDPRYRPSLIQKRMMEAGLLGRKSGKGYFDYKEQIEKRTPELSEEKADMIFHRILAMLINEAVDALYLGIATEQDLDLAMTKGVNYPKGLIAWGRELGFDKVLKQLDELYHTYGDMRYRASALLRKGF